MLAFGIGVEAFIGPSWGFFSLYLNELKSNKPKNLSVKSFSS